MSLKDFVNWLAVTSPEVPSMRLVWQFEGAYLAGRIMRDDEEFPPRQPLAMWQQFYTMFVLLAENYQ